MKQFHALLTDILENGELREDRTNTGTLSVFGRQLRFNLEEGFPAITTKKLAWKSVVSELLWFIEGTGDERRLAEILYGSRDTERSTIWTGNAQAAYWTPKARYDGDLGRVYGVGWRRWECNDWENEVTLVKKRDSISGDNKPFYIDFPVVVPDSDTGDDLVGTVRKNKSGEEFTVLSNVGVRSGNTYYKIQFNAGIRTVLEISRPNIRTGSIKNPYNMSVASGSGCYGIVTEKSEYLNRAYILWRNMMERCHGTDPIKTIYYKQKGIYVTSEWRCFANFYRDIHGLVGFNSWRNNSSVYALDKDYFCSSFYSKETTIFLPERYNNYILSSASSKEGKLFIATNSVTGKVFKYTSLTFLRQWAKRLNVPKKENGKRHWKQWHITEQNPPHGYVWRQKFYSDQLSNLIEGIKKDPNGRRHVLTAWNVDELDQMALPPCHVLAQFYVSNGKLSCHMYQRSCDVYLGIPFNIASYALLTHMIAQVCELKAGELIISTGDTHIYLNHIGQVKEQLSREPYPLPTLWLNPNINDINDFRMENIDLEGYKSHPALPAPMAV
jgi:thymidylate synthase